MTKPIVVEEKPITLSELKGEIEKIKKRDKELNFRAVKVDEYLQTFEPISQAKAEELTKKLEKMDITRIKPEHIAKIVDMLPTNEQEVEMLFQGQALSISKETAKKIADLVKEYV